MWRTPGGDRILTPGGWALVRAGLARAWDAIEAARQAPGGPGPTGVRVFNALQNGRQVGLLAHAGGAQSLNAAGADQADSPGRGALVGALVAGTNRGTKIGNKPCVSSRIVRFVLFITAGFLGFSASCSE
jgi:hypothetical protein